jgi:hypothetical protein
LQHHPGPHRKPAATIRRHEWRYEQNSQNADRGQIDVTSKMNFRTRSERALLRSSCHNASVVRTKKSHHARPGFLPHCEQAVEDCHYLNCLSMVSTPVRESNG